jgi:hypothetical protein
MPEGGPLDPGCRCPLPRTQKTRCVPDLGANPTRDVACRIWPTARVSHTNFVAPESACYAGYLGFARFYLPSSRGNGSPTGQARHGVTPLATGACAGPATVEPVDLSYPDALAFRNLAISQWFPLASQRWPDELRRWLQGALAVPGVGAGPRATMPSKQGRSVHR